jgi:hypothetical protein
MRTLLIGSTLLVSSVLALPARATVLIPTDLTGLSHDAIAIVRGRVASVDAQWTADHRTIETLVTLEAESYLKGSLGATVQFRVPGGLLGRYRSIVVGAPQFSVDQHVVVFLGAHGPSVPFVVGFSQGVFRMMRAADNSGWLVTSPIDLPPVTGTVPVVRGDPSRRALALADFERRVRSLAGSTR